MLVQGEVHMGDESSSMSGEVIILLIILAVIGGGLIIKFLWPSIQNLLNLTGA